MQSLQKMFGSSVALLSMFVFSVTAMAAENPGRAAYTNMGRLNRAGVASSPRMPTMPSLPIDSVGNLSPNLPSNGGGVVNPPINPTPDPKPDCPDGGVRNSEYTVEKCMNDILNCVNGGALPRGLNDLFNEDLRNAIVNGMGLCQVQVEKCVTEVRKDCENVYRTAADVWIDFNARKVQPEYYNFVLRKTGLTPNQAENTCLLLDRNTYGSSFNAVATNGAVTAEYNNKVGAYNSQQGNLLIKVNPQGVKVNSDPLGVDGQRGHYARWDATTADCYIRVAAYNKDTHIKNSWLFGAAGDDEPAEVWRAAGDTFSCNKDLFGFSLMNKTSTAAVVGVGGGTLLGAGVGAAAAHGKRDFDCENDKHREMLMDQLHANASIGILNEYLKERIPVSAGTLTKSQCDNIMELYDRYNQVTTALTDCNTLNVTVSETTTREEITEIALLCQPGESVDECFIRYGFNDCAGKGYTSLNQCGEYIDKIAAMAGDNIPTEYSETNDVKSGNAYCMFQPLNLAKAMGTSIYCGASGGCQTAVAISVDVDRLNNVFDSDTTDLIINGEKSTIAKGIGIGAAVGAGTGGLATAITAFVERSNINCRVGDGLAQVGFGKSYAIGSLKDFYVKWNLRLPDVVAPTVDVVDCQSWQKACSALTDLNQCKAAQFNYKPADATTKTLVRSACAVSGSACIENQPVAKSYGACK